MEEAGGMVRAVVSEVTEDPTYSLEAPRAQTVLACAPIC